MNLQENIHRIKEVMGIDESNNLIPVEPNRFVYHKSNPIFRNQINDEGLITKGKSETWLSDTPIEGEVIFATNSDDEQDWFDSPYDDDIYQIDTTKIDNIWFNDPNFRETDDNKHIITFNNIPKKAIKLIYQGTGDNLQENVERIHEQSESKKDALKSMLKQSGIQVTSKLMGGIDNLVRVLYDGDIMGFSEDTHTPLAYMSTDKMRFYIHEALVEKLGLNENSRTLNRGEKELGDFRFGPKDGIGYKFTARLLPTTLHDQPYYKVVGTSGDSGFGYGFISKKNILGSRYRQQIFKQIIDKYDLEPYMELKSFY